MGERINTFMGSDMNMKSYDRFFGESVHDSKKLVPYVIVNDNGSVRPNFDNKAVLDSFKETLAKARKLREQLTLQTK